MNKNNVIPRKFKELKFRVNIGDEDYNLVKGEIITITKNSRNHHYVCEEKRLSFFFFFLRIKDFYELVEIIK